MIYIARLTDRAVLDEHRNARLIHVRRVIKYRYIYIYKVADDSLAAAVYLIFFVFVENKNTKKQCVFRI